MRETEISPSILSADFANLEKDIKKIEKHVTRLHLDVMDGHFVPNITFGPPLVKSIRKVTGLLLETHLMIEHPERFIKAFKDAGSDCIIIHYESIKNPSAILKQIKDLGIKCGISIKPKTSWEKIKQLLNIIDLVLIMSVEPGFGGQSFIYGMTDKIRLIADYKKKNHLKLDIEVDGGINAETAKLASDAGADILVAGASIFGTEDTDAAITAIKNSVQQ